MINLLLFNHNSSYSGLVWGWMPFLWSQVVIVEVHGLNLIFGACALVDLDLLIAQ